MRKKTRTDKFIHKTATVVNPDNVGEGAKIWHNAVVREDTIIGYNASIGGNAYIGRFVTIGNYSRIGNNAYLPRGVVIEPKVFIGPGVIFCNDRYPEIKDYGDSFIPTNPTIVTSGAVIGAGSVILPGLRIKGKVGAGSVVTDDIPDDGYWYYGNPARKPEYAR